MKLTKAQQEIVDICRAHEHSLEHDSVANKWRLTWTDGNFRPTKSVNPRTTERLIDSGYFVEECRNAGRYGPLTVLYRLKESTQ